MADNKHSCAIYWDCTVTISINVQCIRNIYAMHWIDITYDKQCNRIKSAMHCNKIADDKHS